ncbi:MAG TPA: Spy/CpxP family protein refolding chaperone [Burkholderiales bacterium]|nr:Spy/CpxP family protein refolding chaperone [Burkholderiales bacterium]
MKKRAWFGFLLAGITSAALAQLGGARRGRRGGGDDQKKGGEEPRVNPIEVTLHEFHEDLKLTDAQEPAWEQYVAKLRALANDAAREQRSSRQSVQMNVLQRIDRIIDSARNRLTALEDIAQSAKSLYAGLTPDQQKLADPRLANIIAMPLAAGSRP